MGLCNSQWYRLSNTKKKELQRYSGPETPAAQQMEEATEPKDDLRAHRRELLQAGPTSTWACPQKVSCGRWQDDKNPVVHAPLYGWPATYLSEALFWRQEATTPGKPPGSSPHLGDHCRGHKGWAAPTVFPPGSSMFS